jgi:hypothetical protein
MASYNPCPNCGGNITCSCQYQHATDGKICCDDCISAYNLSLIAPAPPVVEEKIETQEHGEQDTELSDGTDNPTV